MSGTSRPLDGGVDTLALRYRGRLAALAPADLGALCDRAQAEDARVRTTAMEIVARVRREGDAALRALAREFDGASLDALEVPRGRVDAALARLDPALRAVLERAARNLEAAHRASAPVASEAETEPGVVVGRRPDPFDRVGVYAPGGRALYPSSVLMGAVPARVAGVREIVLCSPPGPGGAPDDLVLAAAAIAGVDRVFALGGAGAIAALAYGTESVPRVAKIVGPGNAYVAAAKRLVAGDGAAAIDAPAGPSELLVIADDTADGSRVALELIAQAEHDPEAVAIALVVGPDLAARVVDELARLVPRAGRASIVRASLAAAGGVLEVATLDEALAFAERFAPEHLQLAVRDPEVAFARVRNAGTVCLGTETSVAFGDYLTGSNHVLPTAGFARLASGLSTHDFVRWTTWQRVTPEAAAALSGDVSVFARIEGLPGHAEAAAAGGVHRAVVVPAMIALDDNMNLFGVPPGAAAALAGAARGLPRYPSAESDALRDALAGYTGAAPEEIVTGCGSDDVLDFAFRALAAPGDLVAWSDPTFSMLPEFARHNRLRAHPVRALAGGAPDIDALLEGAPALIYLCSPNNPTGELVADAALAEVLERTDGIVILDQAYAEFESAGLASAPPRHPRLLVTRTFSKAFALAGLRVGYGIGPRAIVARLAAVRGPYRVGGVAERAALAALGEDSVWVAGFAAEAIRIRERLAVELRARGLAPLPSRANFLLVPVADATACAAGLAARGVQVRAFPGLARVGDAVRITVGPWPLMERLLAALEEERP